VRDGLFRNDLMSRGIARIARWILPAPRIREKVLKAGDRKFLVTAADAGRTDFPCPDESPAIRGRGRLHSSLCSVEQLDSDAFRYWCERMKRGFCYHRKLWEWAFVCQALYERGLLARGKRGLGFAVGTEPLASLFASRGCEIVATDLDRGDTRASNWSGNHQLASAARLNENGLCDAAAFRRLVTFRPVDMNRIPNDLGGFDFTWSSCSFEHCGSIELGLEFLWSQMECLAPGGCAVHTTELNLSSNRRTIRSGDTVLFRRRDLEDFLRRLAAAGHAFEPLDLSLGNHPLDRQVDRPPYSPQAHLRLELGSFVTTSIGLILYKAGQRSADLSPHYAASRRKDVDHQLEITADAEHRRDDRDR